VSGIDTIIFDLGNVLLEVHEQRGVERLAARTGKTGAEIEAYLRSKPHATELALGKLTRRQFFRTVARDLALSGAYEDFAVIWSEIFEPIEPMISLAKNLKARVTRLILSNTNAIHMDYIFEHYPWIHEFDAHVLSYEVGMLKPDTAIFQHALDKYRLTAARAVFIDDLSANVEGARRLGMCAIQFESAEQVRQELTKLGVEPI
jgi:putative hydrolase of the HAD superfamily